MAITATNVREELRPRCVLVDDIPDLGEEGDKKNTSSTIPHFRLVDPVEHEQIDKENAATEQAAGTARADHNTSGLRNRKAKESAAKEEWTFTEDSNLVDEETKLRSLDPIDLFGLPNPILPLILA